MQALLFAALLANARAHVDGDRFFAPVAATLLGLLLFLRFDAVLGIAGVLAGLVLGVFNGQRPRAAFVAIFTALGGARRAVPVRPDAGVLRFSRSCFSAISRGGSTRCSALRAPPAAAAIAFGSAPRPAGQVDAGRRDWGAVGAGPLRAVLPASGGKARAARRLRAADVHELLSHAAGARRRAHRASRSSRAAPSGATRRSSATVSSSAASSSSRSGSSPTTSG